MPDFFGTRYSDEGLRVTASVIAFVFLIPYTAGVYMGISKLFEMGFHIPYEYCAFIMAILTAVYVILGGYKATAINDFIQGIIMLFGICTVIAVVLNTQFTTKEEAPFKASYMTESPVSHVPSVFSSGGNNCLKKGVVKRNTRSCVHHASRKI